MRRRWVLMLALLAWAAPVAAQQEVDASAIYLGTSGLVVKYVTGSGSPEGVLAAPVGTQYVDAATGLTYRKASGSSTTGWLVVLAITPCTTAGQFLRSSGTAWGCSTLILPNAATASRVAYATSTNTWGESANLTFSGTRLTTTEAEVTAAAALLTGQFGAIEQTAYGATGYKSRWNTGYDGVTWIDAFDETGAGAWLPMRFRGLSFAFNAPTSLASTLLVAGAVTAQSSVGSDGYVSETTGWRITPDGAADFQYLTAKELKVKIFTADLEQALAGSETIVKSVATVYANFLCPAKGGTGTLLVEDLPGAADMAVFESGDAVVLRTYSRAGGGLTIGDCVGTVSSPSTAPSGYQSWTFARNAGDNGGTASAGAVLEAGGVALDYGVSGNGAVVLTAVDGIYGANSPYVGVNTFTTAPVTANFTQRVRLGNLKGITGVTNEYGLMAGNGTWTTAGRYFKASNEGVSLVNVPLDLYASGTKVFSIDPATPSMAMGATVPTYTTGAGCWQGFVAGVFKWRCGDPAGDYIDWNGTQLTVNGNIVVTGTSIDASSVNGVAGSTIVAGAQLALVGLDNAGNPLLPATVTTSGSGLYLGSDYLGFFNGSAWRTYMDSSGHFYLGGTSGALQWNGTTLTIAATLSGDGSGITSINGGNITTDTVTATQIAANAITTSELAADSVTSAKIAAKTITAADIAAGTITADEMTVGSLSSISANLGTITAGTIGAGTATIGGWSIGANTLTATNVGLNTATTGGLDYRIWSGDPVAASAEFSVDEFGYLRSTAATFGAGSNGVDVDTSGLTVSGTGRIRAGDAELNIDGVVLYSAEATGNRIKWDASGNYIAGAGGYIRLSVAGAAGTVEFDNTNVFYATSDDITLGSSSDPWGQVFALLPSTTDTEYPVVMTSGGGLEHKTNGLNGSAGCGLVENVTAERGIVTSVACNSALLGRVTDLEQEVAALKALVALLVERRERR